MNIDLSDYSAEDAARILEEEIKSLGLDPSTMRIKVKNVSHEQATRKMTYSFSFERKEEDAK